MQTFCWWCGKKLKLPFFTTVRDQLGHPQKVHKVCAKDAEMEIRPVTAQETANGQFQGCERSEHPTGNES